MKQEEGFRLKCNLYPKREQVFVSFKQKNRLRLTNIGRSALQQFVSTKKDGSAKLRRG